MKELCFDTVFALVDAYIRTLHYWDNAELHQARLDMTVKANKVKNREIEHPVQRREGYGTVVCDAHVIYMIKLA